MNVIGRLDYKSDGSCVLPETTSLLDGAGSTALTAWVRLPSEQLVFRVCSSTPPCSICCSQKDILDVSVQMTLGVHHCISIFFFKCLKLPFCLLCRQLQEKGETNELLGLMWLKHVRCSGSLVGMSLGASRLTFLSDSGFFLHVTFPLSAQTSPSPSWVPVGKCHVCSV